MKNKVCTAAAIALEGLVGEVVQVEAAVANQLPGISIIGLPDTALAEAKQRVKLATQQAGFTLTDRFLVVNLSPATLPKQGSGFDLAIALAALAASGELPGEQLSEVVHLGELGLDAKLRRPPGLLSAVLAARSHGFQRVMVPAVCAREAALVPDIEVIAADSLAGAVAWHRGETDGWSAVNNQRIKVNERENDAEEESAHYGTADMADVIGQPEIVEALVVAAAGRHHVSMVGPPGAGKTLLATRLVSILPDLSAAESISASSIASLGGHSLNKLVRRPPFESPHHTASRVAITGGGDSKGVSPGAITRASYGVLFLDEAPEFSKRVLEDLRQPLESKTIEIQRAKTRVTLPAALQLVLAANPCPCGFANSVDSPMECKCTPHQRINYLGRISGPLADRIDISLQVSRVKSMHFDDGIEGAAKRPTSAELRKRVTAARERAAHRLRNTPWQVNGDVDSTWLRGAEGLLPKQTTAVIDAAFARGSLSMRGYDKTLRTAWTIADLRGKERPERAEISRALTLRGVSNEW